MDAVNEFLQYLTADRGYSAETVRSYRTGLKDFSQFFQSLDSGLTWESVDADVVRRWMAARIQGGLQPQTVRRALSALRAFYRYQLLTGHMAHNPMQRVQNPKVPRRLPVFLKATEMDHLLDDVTFPDTFRGHRDHLMLLVFYTTGIRVSELVGLDGSDINLSGRELKVTGKRNKQRVVPFGPELADAFGRFFALLNHEGLSADGPVFCNTRGRRLTAAEARRIVHDWLSAVTTQRKRSPHVLRHTFATVMLNNGADLEAVRELLGHESLAATEVYTHTTFAELKAVYAQAHPREAEGAKNVNNADR